MRGNLTGEVLSKYANKVFVETGTYKGAAVLVALDCGFEVIHSIEIDYNLFEQCRDKFSGYNNVFIHFGDSKKLLYDVIKNISCNITFWLDGHNVGSVPILDELEQISKHSIKTHTILIDDRRVMGTDIWSGISEQDVINSVMKVNGNYKMVYEDSTNAKNDILVAII